MIWHPTFGSSNMEIIGRSKQYLRDEIECAFVSFNMNVYRNLDFVKLILRIRSNYHC